MSHLRATTVTASLVLAHATCSTGPEQPAVPTVWQAVYAGGNFTCGLDGVGRAFCWGTNQRGLLGTGDTTDSATPVPVAGGLRFRVLSAGHRHACGVTQDGALYCWGANLSGELGLGVAGPPRLTPSRVPLTVAVGAVSAVAGHSCALATAGEAYCWGLNSVGQLGTSASAQACPPYGNPCTSYPVRVSSGGG